LHASIAIQFRKQRENLIALSTVNPAHGVITGLKTLGPCTVRQHNLMLVEHEVDIAGALRVQPFNSIATY
jgi:hypothetical protein